MSIKVEDCYIVIYNYIAFYNYTLYIVILKRWKRNFNYLIFNIVTYRYTNASDAREQISLLYNVESFEFVVTPNL